MGRTTGAETGAGTSAAAETVFGMVVGAWPLGPGGARTPGAAGSAGGATPAWPGFDTTFAVRNTTSSRRSVSVRSFLNSQPSTGIFESQGIPRSSLLKRSWRRPAITTVPPSTISAWVMVLRVLTTGAVSPAPVTGWRKTSSFTAIVMRIRPSPTTRGVTWSRVVTSV